MLVGGKTFVKAEIVSDGSTRTCNFVSCCLFRTLPRTSDCLAAMLVTPCDLLVKACDLLVKTRKQTAKTETKLVVIIFRRMSCISGSGEETPSVIFENSLLWLRFWNENSHDDNGDDGSRNNHFDFYETGRKEWGSHCRGQVVTGIPFDPHTSTYHASSVQSLT